MLKFWWLPQCGVRNLEKIQFSCYAFEANVYRYGVRCCNINHGVLRKHHSFRRAPINVKGFRILSTTHQQKCIRRLQQWNTKVDRVNVDVLNEARYQMGYPNWFNMFKTCFLGVSVNTGPEDTSNLLLSFVEHYFQDEDFEIESLIVLLLASMAEKLSRLQQRGHPPDHNQQQHTALPQNYDDFRAVTNAGHVILANSLLMTRILILVQQVSTITEAMLEHDCDSELDDHFTTRQIRSQPCTKLDKVRILLSDLFIAAVFKEAANTKNSLILQYSFKAMNSAIEGIFKTRSKNIKVHVENTTTEFVRENSLKKARLRIGLDTNSNVHVTSGGYMTTKFNTFSTLLKEQIEYTPEHSENIPSSVDTNYKQLKTPIRDKYSCGKPRYYEQYKKNINQLKYYGSGKEQNMTLAKQNKKSSKYLDENFMPALMERRDKQPQGMYGWGWTSELGVTCQGCVALSGLGYDLQKAAFNFGSTIPLIRQMQWNRDLASLQEVRYLSRLASYLNNFPDCSNKRLLISLCKAYIFR